MGEETVSEMGMLKKIIIIIVALLPTSIWVLQDAVDVNAAAL